MTIIPVTKIADILTAKVGPCMFFQRVTPEQAARTFEMVHKRPPEKILSYTNPLFGTVSLYLPIGAAEPSLPVPQQN